MQGSPQDESANPSAQAAQDQAQATPTAAGNVPSAPARVDHDAEVLKRLDAGETPAQILQSPERVTPSTKEPKARKSDAATATEAPAEAEQSAASEYEGIDAKAESTLRRAGLLENITPDDWAQLSQKNRDNLTVTAKTILKERGRVGQQLGQARKAAAAQEYPYNDGNLDPEVDAETEGQSPAGTADDEPRYTAAEWRAMQTRGVRAQPNPPGRAETATQVADPFAGLRDVVGDEALAPLVELYDGQRQAVAQVVQQNNALTLQLESLHRARFEPLEQQAFESLEKLTGNQIDAETRQKIIATAFELAKVSSRPGKPIDWKQMVERAGRAVLDPDIRTQAQQQLAQRRTESLRASPAKATALPRAARVMSKEDKDAMALSMLDSGKSAAEVAAALAG